MMDGGEAQGETGCARASNPRRPESDAASRTEIRNSVKEIRSTGRPALYTILVVGLTLGGIAALLSSTRAFADTSTSASGTKCAVIGSTVSSGTAVRTSPSVDSISTTPSQTDLAFTGTDLAEAAVVGLVLIGAGLLLVFGSRAHRRRRTKVLGGAVLGVLIAHHLLPAGQASAATNCAFPPAVLPETPEGILLPLLALLIFAAAYVWLCRSRAVS